MTTTELRLAGGPPAAPSPQAAPPPGQAVPRLVDTGAEFDLSETLVTDRGLLQTLLSVDGRRTIAEISAGRGPDAVTHLQALAAQGLISIDVPAPAAPRPRRPAARLRRRRPGRPGPGRPHGRLVNCPKLGFWDNPASHYSRPTQLHRCFASGTPAPLTADQQVHVCLTREFGTCPRLAGAMGRAPRRRPSAGAPPAAPAEPAPVPPGAVVCPPRAEARAGPDGRATHPGGPAEARAGGCPQPQPPAAVAPAPKPVAAPRRPPTGPRPRAGAGAGRAPPGRWRPAPPRPRRAGCPCWRSAAAAGRPRPRPLPSAPAAAARPGGPPRGAHRPPPRPGALAARRRSSGRRRRRRGREAP